MLRDPLQRLAALGVAAVVAGGIAVPAYAASSGHGTEKAKHVLLLSVDGLHQSDLTWYVRNHPHSALAALVSGATSYTRASTPLPSDSFPGMVAQVTGGNPKTTGVYYDDSFNHRLLPPGTTKCAGVTPGTEVNYTESLDKNTDSIDAGQGLPGLPGGVLAMTGKPQTLIDPAKLPVDPTTCKPVYPHQYLKVNTVFEVARKHGLRTAWSDKHAAYELLNGPSGTGIDDLFTPEINSLATGFSGDWTQDNAATQQYDGYKVRAVLNEIDGYDHSRATKAGTPAVFGMNFQSVSTAEKLPVSGGKTGGYLPGGTVPGPVLSGALDFVDAQVGRLVAELRAHGLTKRTAIILSAKHGQSPKEPEALTRLDDGAIIDALNAAWTAAHPGAKPLVAFSTDDDALQLWLSDRSQAAADFARKFLLTHPATGNTITGATRTLQASGLTKVYAGTGAAKLFGSSDPGRPDLFGFVQHGVVYTGKKAKIAEHGGNDPQDRNVPLVVSVPGGHGAADNGKVETTQIAPTILRLLGLDPKELKAVRVEHTRALSTR
ncbi:MAG: hypothetical protein JWN52_6406 [Actinomycetia bacterium]|nr:hypothetical protein [Actinomycetes bacterium]